MSKQTSSQLSIKKLADKLAEIKETAHEIAPEPENQIVVTGVVAAIRKLLNRLYFLSGVTHAEKFEALPPIIYGNATEPETHKPSLSEKEIFLQRVDVLHKQVATLSPEGILNDYSFPGDDLVIRGVAKRAGLENFEDAELTVEFIEKIQEAIKANEADDALQRRIDAELAADAALGIDGDGTIDDAEFEEDEEEGEEEFEEGEEIEIPVIDELTGLAPDEPDPVQPPAPERKKPGPKPKQQ